LAWSLAKVAPPAHRIRTIARDPATICKRVTRVRARGGVREKQALAIPLEPGAAALIRLGVALAIEAYERDPQATLARHARRRPLSDPSGVAGRGVSRSHRTVAAILHFPFGPRGSGSK